MKTIFHPLFLLLAIDNRVVVGRAHSRDTIFGIPSKLVLKTKQRFDICAFVQIVKFLMKSTLGAKTLAEIPFESVFVQRFLHRIPFDVVTSAGKPVFKVKRNGMLSGIGPKRSKN